MKLTVWITGFLAAVVLFVFQAGIIHAAPVQDNNAGTWTDGYADNTGISSRSQADVDVSDGKLKLTNSGGGFTAPYYSSGVVRTISIVSAVGTKIAKWNNITVTSTQPTGTTVNIKVEDEANAIYSNALLSGNESGFTGSSIDISSLPVERNAAPGGAKVPRIRLLISMATTDTNVTPAIDSIVVSWTTSQGDLTATTLAQTAWPTWLGNNKNTLYSSYHASQPYPVIRWIKNQENTYPGIIIRGTGNTLFNKLAGGSTNGSDYLDGGLLAINRNTGETIWQATQSGYIYTDSFITLGQNGTIYLSGIQNDVVAAYDGNSNGAIKWIYQLNSGHTTNQIVIGSDGTIYTTRYNGAADVYAFNPDGSLKWSKDITQPGSGASQTSTIGLGSDGRIYVSAWRVNDYNSSRLYALNSGDGTTSWNVPVNPSPYLVLDDSDSIYLLDGFYSGSAIARKIMAVKSDGTTKWERSLGTTIHYYINTPSSNTTSGILYGVMETSSLDTSDLEAISTTDGSVVWTFPVSTSSGYAGSGELLSDGAGGIFFTTSVYGSEANLRYLDSSGNQKWKINHKFSGGAFEPFTNMAFDESSRLYLNLGNWLTTYDNILFALYPWTLSVTSSGTSTGFYKPGDQISFTVTTAMQQTNLLTGNANKIQVVMDNNDKVSLSYNSTDSNGDTIWTGTYTIPAGTSDGSHTYTVEANAAGIQTDIALNFTTPATDSNNTGLTTTGSFTIDNSGPASFELISPAGESNDFLRPTLTFKKTSDSVSNVASYTVSLDDGRNTDYSVSGLPASGGNRDNSQVKVEYINESDTDATNDQITVYFKGLDKKDLNEGRHGWKVIAYDTAGNATTKSQDFFLDRTSPVISELAIAKVASISQSGVYLLDPANRMPFLSGKADDIYKGSDTTDSVSSGPDSLTLTIKKRSTSLVYENYLSKEYPITDVTDIPGDVKTARFYFQTPFLLVDGYYQVLLSAKDKVGNKGDYPVFYFSINQIQNSNPPVINNPMIKIQPSSLETKIIEEQKVTPQTQTEIKQTKEQGYSVKVKIVDQERNPVAQAQVTLHSEPQTGLTDNNGEVTFSNVEPGEHKIVLAYQNYTGEQNINLEGEVKQFEYTIQIVKKNELWPLPAIIVIGILIIIVVALLFLLWRRKRKG